MDKMRVLFAALLLVAGCQPAMASGKLTQEQMLEGCSMIGAMAEEVMRRRQTNEPAENLIREVSGETWAVKMIAEAYQKPAFPGPFMEDARDMLISGFRDRYYVKCLEKISRGKG